ncbi:hypothetical protein CMUST_08785 [Corynebacterium mustelae]|uniref:DUF2029 family protein n=1 Tax=Corynebacterium mustelae TaxID=571915 RepID=A0A0G3GY42_9CORY|nr:hypothetical protein [Corynebacterium mustelae]AKK06081.1 hypothetical protein CMUST_08785 [Corynebacterium mustelae]
MSGATVIKVGEVQPQVVRLLWLWWLIAHGLLLRLLVINTVPDGDVRYYFDAVSGLNPIAMREYPIVGTWPAYVALWFSNGSSDHYLAMFTMVCYALDAIFFAIILHTRIAVSSQARITAAVFWGGFSLVVGHVCVYRLDIFPSVVVGVAAICLFLAPRCSAGLLAIAVMIKLWPGVLIVGLVDSIRRSKTYVRVGIFIASLVLITGVVIPFSGIDRLLSPFSYQGERGLQIESVAATPFMWLANTRTAENYVVFYAASKSYEISGPGVATAIGLSSFLLLATLIAAALWAFRRLWVGGWSPDQTVVLWIFLIVMLIISNKVFSPQYIVWLGPVLAVALLRARKLKFPLFMAVLIYCMALLGQVVYPFHYHELTDNVSEMTIGVVGLAARNILMVVATIIAGIWLVKTPGGENAKQSVRFLASRSGDN